jgi:two-component system, NtrC family, response regulator AtoC
MAGFKIFIVDDDPWYSEVLGYYLSQNPDYEVSKFVSAKDFLAHLSGKPDLVTLDYTLNDGNGIDVLRKIKQYDPELPVIIISSQEDIATAISLIRSGAYDYLVKDNNTNDFLLNAVNRLREHLKLKKEVDQLKDELVDNFELRKTIKGNSPAMAPVFNIIRKASSSNINVSISGETGTGKEVVAKAIHFNSDRRKRPFVAINMAAIPKELMESELFGYEKGAFTGANSRKIGKFEEANKGTIFLDEIGELDLSLQSKLLRVIQEREVVRLGGQERVTLDVRIIVATHKNLESEVNAGNFREDFYYRIIGLPIVLPPLRDRGEDILLLAKFFLDAYCQQNKVRNLKINNAAREKMMAYNFPGNIRELKSVIELAAVMCDGEEIDASDITFRGVSIQKRIASTEKPLKAYVNEIVTYYLEKYDKNIPRVAEVLQIGKSTIYKMISDGEITI